MFVSFESLSSSAVVYLTLQFGRFYFRRQISPQIDWPQIQSLSIWSRCRQLKWMSLLNSKVKMKIVFENKFHLKRNKEIKRKVYGKFSPNYSLLSILRCKWLAILWRASLYSKCKPNLNNDEFFSTNSVISISILFPKTDDRCEKSNLSSCYHRLKII